MKMMKVVYSDKFMSERERFETPIYDAKTAKAMADELATLGCYEFEFVEIKDEKAA